MKIAVIVRVLLSLAIICGISTAARENRARNAAANHGTNHGTGANGTVVTPAPGVRVRVSQKGVDYGAKVAIDMLMKHLDSLTLPEFDVSVAGTSVVLSGMVIKELPRPSMLITLLSSRSPHIGRFRVDVTDLHPVIDANMSITYKSWFLTTSKNGSATTTAENMTVSLVFTLGVTENGSVTILDTKCNATGDKVEFELTGEFQRWSSFVGTLYDTLKSLLKPAIFAEMCSNILKDINKTNENILKTAAMTAVFEEDYEFDYGLTRSPLITRNFMETSHKGGIYLVQRTSDPPFHVPSIPPFQQHHDKMVYMYVTDYVGNTGWYSALKNGDLKFSSSDNVTTMPPLIQNFLATSCPGSTCLGTVFPQLAWLYPNSVAGVDVFATTNDRPVVRFRGRSVRMRCDGVAEFYMMTDRSRDHILTVNVTVVASLGLVFENNKIVFQVTNFNIETDISKSSLNLLFSFTELLFDTFIATTGRLVFLPALQALGRQGFPLTVPDVPELKFIDPVVVEHNNQGVLIIGTDIQYEVPDAY